jgi:hypothetical protein
VSLSGAVVCFLSKQRNGLRPEWLFRSPSTQYRIARASGEQRSDSRTKAGPDFSEFLMGLLHHRRAETDCTPPAGSKTQPALLTRDTEPGTRCAISGFAVLKTFRYTWSSDRIHAHGLTKAFLTEATAPTVLSVVFTGSPEWLAKILPNRCRLCGFSRFWHLGGYGNY